MPRKSATHVRAPLTRQRITAAAVHLADVEGVEGLSMRALAALLNVEAMSLYNHVRNKDDLLDAMVETVIAEVALPRAHRNWREEMRRRAVSMRKLFLAHPWAPPLIAQRINVGPNMLALTEATLACLVSAGFSYPEADHIWNALDSHVYGFHLIERSFPLKPADYADTARAFLPSLPPEKYPHMHAFARLVAEGAHDGINDFAFGLDLLLNAIKARRSKRRMTGEGHIG